MSSIFRRELRQAFRSRLRAEREQGFLVLVQFFGAVETFGEVRELGLRKPLPLVQFL